MLSGCIIVGGVGCVAVLVVQIPDAVWCEVKSLWSCAITCTVKSLVEVIKCGSVCLREVCEAE